MSEFYDDMRGIASELLNEFQQGKIEYVELVPGDGPADNPGVPTDRPVTVPGVVRGVKFRYIDNKNVVASDLQATIPVDLVTPMMNGFMRVDNSRYKIVQIVPKPAAGEPVVHVVIFRK
jgi:hypothetical protein